VTIDQLKVEADDVQPCVKKLSVEIPESVLSEEYGKAFEKIRKTASVHGFRKGKVPKEILKKLYADSVLWEVGQKLIGGGYEQALKDHSLRPYGEPSIENVNLKPDEPVSFTATVELFPDVTLPDTSGWEFERKVEAVDDEAIEAPFQAFLEEHAELAPVEGRPVKEGDYITLNMRGTVDGTEVAPLTGKNRDLIVTVNKDNVLAGFHEELAGMEKGEQKKFKITLSKNFPAPELAEKEVEFDVEITAIREKRIPELTDDFVKANTEYKSVDEMRARIRKNLEENAAYLADEEARRQVLDRLIKEADFALPPKMIEEYTRLHEARVKSRAGQSGVELEKTPDFDKEKFDESCREIGEKEAREEILIGEIAEKEKIVPDKKEVEKIYGEYLRILESRDIEPEEMKRRAYTLAVNEVMRRSVFKFLMSQVQIKDTILEKEKK